MTPPPPQPTTTTTTTPAAATATATTTTTTTATTILQPFVWDHLGKPVPEKNIRPVTPILIINHPLSTSPSTTIRSILPVQFMCLTLLHNLSPSLFWSASWSDTLYFILHTFLHPNIVFFSQHMPILSQSVCSSTEIVI